MKTIAQMAPSGWYSGPEYFEGHEGAHNFWVPSGERKVMSSQLVWVLEPRPNSHLLYWCGSREGKFWSFDFEAAMWFVRKVDAEKYMEDQNIFGVAVQHAWVANK